MGSDFGGVCGVPTGRGRFVLGLPGVLPQAGMRCPLWGILGGQLGGWTGSRWGGDRADRADPKDGANRADGANRTNGANRANRADGADGVDLGWCGFWWGIQEEWFMG
jgi:hypothetical protein